MKKKKKKKNELGNKTTMSYLSGRQSASGDSSSGGPQHLVAGSFDCRPESYEIVVYCNITKEFISF